jgi:hypothetical protein
LAESNVGGRSEAASVGGLIVSRRALCKPLPYQILIEIKAPEQVGSYMLEGGNRGGFVVGECDMKVLAAFVALSALGMTSASAQVLLSGAYQCVQNCRGPGLAYVTQNGWELNLVNEAGQPSRAWIDYPGHIWAQYWNEGAIYSPDGFAIQFDDGTVWQRFVPPPPPPPVLRRRG